MELLLTILSVLALWLFLTFLVIGLLLILKPLESVREHLQKVTAGVRAIEQETKPLAGHLDTLATSLPALNNTLRSAVQETQHVNQDLDAVTPILQNRLQP